MLLDDARSCRESLMRAEAAQSGIEEASALATKKRELQQLADRIAILAHRNALLLEQSVPLTPVADIDKAKQRISQIRDRFAELPKAVTLSDKQRWKKLESTLIEFIASAEAVLKQDWKNYFNSTLFGGLPPEQRQQTIPLEPLGNKEALKRYTSLYQRFKQYRNTVPDTAEALNEVLFCSNELASIEFVENSDLPAPVIAFFNAVSSGSGASLDFLTQDVIEWLRANNMLANYVIRAR